MTNVLLRPVVQGVAAAGLREAALEIPSVSAPMGVPLTRFEHPFLPGRHSRLGELEEDSLPTVLGGDSPFGTLVSRQGDQPPGQVIDPIELVDARPSGFLGRHFAIQHGDLRLPARLTDWSDHHILLALARRGEDLPGNGVALPTTMQLQVFGGADGRFTLVEDSDDNGLWASTRYEFSSFAGALRIYPVLGDPAALAGVPARRDYLIDLIGLARVQAVELVTAGDRPVLLTPEPGPTPGSLRVRVPAVDARTGARLRIVGDGSTRSDNQVRQRLFRLLDAGQIPFEDKERVWSLVNRVRDPHDAALAMHALNLSESLLGAVVEILLAR